MTTDNYAREQAKAQMASVSAMVAALNCDYDRLEELRNELDELQSAIEDATDDQDRDELAVAESALESWREDNGAEFEGLDQEAGDCEDQDAARQRIEEDALSVEVRSDWHGLNETLEPAEFCILICTGGPAVRIIGELNQHREPCSARLQYQDWGTPWTELLEGVDHDALIDYASVFYFGE